MLENKNLYVRYRDMYQRSKDSIAESTVVEAKLKYQKTLAAYEAALAIGNVIAATDGTISATNLAVGDYVAANTLLATITNNQDLQIKYNLPSRYSSQVKTEQAVLFHHDNKVFHAKVSYISPALDKQNFNLRLRANFDDNTQLKPNTFGKVTKIINAKYKALSIPQNLAQADAQGL